MKHAKWRFGRLAPTPQKHVVATATSLVLVGAFVVGAFALGQSVVDFDPTRFSSAYDQNLEDDQSAYQTASEQTDEKANISKTQDQEHEKSVREEHSPQEDDSFSKASTEQKSGTTVYKVSDEGEASASTNAGENSPSDGGGSGVSGPLVPGGSGGNSGGNTGAEAGGPGDNTGAGGTGSGGNAGGGSGGGSDDKVVIPNNPIKKTKPVHLPSDPETKKWLVDDYVPVVSKDPDFEDVVLDQNSDKCNAFVSIYPADDSSVSLYAGQKLDPWTIFCALEAKFVTFDPATFDLKTYTWTTTKSSFSTYPFFKVVDYPEIAPEGSFDVTVAYRVCKADEWLTQKVTFTSSESRIYVVSAAPDADGSPQVLDTKSSGTWDASDHIDLLRYTKALLEKDGAVRSDGSLSALVMGWQDEDGNEISFPYRYEVQKGRHVLSPSAYTELSGAYRAVLKSYWFDGAYSEDDSGSLLLYLQTLTGFDARSARETQLEVPHGIQAISISSDSKIHVDKLIVPASVLSIDLEAGGLLVADAFEVDSANLNYAVSAEGVLTNKAGTKYLGIPLDRTTLDVPASVERVDFPVANQLQSVVLHATSYDQLPQMDLSRLNSCNITIEDSLFDDFVEQNYEILSKGSNTLSLASDPSVVYHVADGMIYSDDKLLRVFDTGMEQLIVNGPHVITKGCMSEVPGIKTLVLTGDGSYSFEDACLEGSSVSLIVCSTQAQYDALKGELGRIGVPDAQLSLVETSKEGHRYYVTSQNGQERTTLLACASDATSFDGKLTSPEGSELALNVIGKRAFAGLDGLRWITLPESVDTLAEEALRGCSHLEGLFIANRESISVGAKALANLPSLRYVASRAMKASFEGEVAPNDACAMFCPTESEGYVTPFEFFDASSNVDDFDTVTLSDGTRLLYGCYRREPWLLLGGAASMSGKVSLPTTTKEIFVKAFAETKGPFTLNWDELDYLQWVDDRAFEGSGLVGAVHLGTSADNKVGVGQYAFSGATGITSFESDATNFSLADTSFFGCTGLVSARLAVGDLVYGGSITSGIFGGCSSLESVEFTSEFVPDLVRYGGNQAFTFNGDWSAEEESGKLSLKVPEGLEKRYINAWIYPFAGYSDYDSLYSAMQKRLMREHEAYPSDAQVRKEMSKELLDAENRLRGMMGLEKVTVSSFLPLQDSNGYVFISADGVTTLIEAPEDATDVDLGTVAPESVKSFVVGKSAFAGCKDLKSVTVPDCVSKLESGLFAPSGKKGTEDYVSHEGITVRITSSRVALPKSADGEAFGFGERVALEVPEDIREDCLAAWPLQSYVNPAEDGSYGDEELLWYLFDVISSDMTEEELDRAVNEPFLSQENYFRELMGLDKISSLDQLAFRYDTSGWLEASAAPAEEGDSNKKNGETRDDSATKEGTEAKGENGKPSEQGDASSSGASAGDAADGGSSSSPDKADTSGASGDASGPQAGSSEPSGTQVPSSGVASSGNANDATSGDASGKALSDSEAS